MSKVGIIGTGHVGSQVLTEVIHLGLFSEITVIDTVDKLAEGEALDHHHAKAFHHMNNVNIKGGEIQDVHDADLIIIAAGQSLPKESEKPDRTLLTASSTKMIREIMRELVKVTTEAVIITITNPLDTILYIAQSEFNYPKEKIFGTGTTLDSARLKSVISDYYDIDPKSIQANMMGEHGMTAFPAFSKITIDGIPIQEFTELAGRPLIDEQMVKDHVVQVANDVLNYKGWTNAGIAQGAAALAKAVMLDERTIFPVCTVIDQEYGYKGDVAFSMPCVIGRSGVINKLEIKLTEQETAALHASAAYIKETIAKAKQVK